MFLNILANCIEAFLFFVFLWNVFGISRVGRVFCGALGIVCMQTGFSLLKIDTSIAFMATVIVFIFVGTMVFRGKTSEKVFLVMSLSDLCQYYKIEKKGEVRKSGLQGQIFLYPIKKEVLMMQEGESTKISVLDLGLNVIKELKYSK